MTTYIDNNEKYYDAYEEQLPKETILKTQPKKTIPKLIPKLIPESIPESMPESMLESMLESKSESMLESMLESKTESMLESMLESILEVKKINKKKYNIEKKNGEIKKEQKKFSNEDNEYLEYKAKIFGDIVANKSDNYCEFYLLNNDNLEQIKYFSNNVKEYALNSKCDDEHILNMVSQIKKSKELYFVNPIACVEYINYFADTPKDLLEIIDGHHRIKCLQRLFKDAQYVENDIRFTFWIQIYKCQNENDALQLFKKYNTVKPFLIDFELKDIIIIIIDKLNEKFNKNKFEFIKNTNQRTNKPSISKKEFIDKLEQRIKEQIKTIEYTDYSDIQIDNIITKFINYNNSLLSENIELFRKKNAKISTITENMFKKAQNSKCVLGLIPLEDLIKECVCL
jgi:hypothetical protein